MIDFALILLFFNIRTQLKKNIKISLYQVYTILEKKYPILYDFIYTLVMGNKEYFYEKNINF